MKYSKSNRFYLKSQSNGFGYVIMDKGESISPPPHVCIFHSSSKEQASRVFETIEENHINFPEPENNWVPKLLKIEEKHCEKYFLIRNPEELNSVSMKYLREFYVLKSDYNPFRKWEYSKHDRWVDEKVIDLCNHDSFKNEMIKNNEQYIKNRRDIDEHNKVIDYVHDVIKNNKVDKAYDLLIDCDFLYRSIVLENFSNEFLGV